MKQLYLYFHLPGGEYHDDMVGVVAIDAEFMSLIERGRKAVQACRAAFYPNDTGRSWFGDVCHRPAQRRMGRTKGH